MTNLWIILTAAFAFNGAHAIHAPASSDVGDTMPPASSTGDQSATSIQSRLPAPPFGPGRWKERPQTELHLKHFGFTLVDVGWDDPSDNIVKTNYVDEVAAFSNVADILVDSPTDPISDRLQLMAGNKVKAILHLNEIFFHYAGAGGLSGALYDLRPDYKARWDSFVTVNNIAVNHALIQAFYIGEEPTWNSISYIELKAATDYVKATVPAVPIMVIEAYPAISRLRVPTTVDWIGFDRYFIKDPKNDSSYRRQLNAIKAKRSTRSQKLVIIMDTHYIPVAHGDLGKLTELDMAGVATRYYELAKSEPDAVALLGYFWPGGFDNLTAKGGRNLPQNARDEFTRIGKTITGK